MGKKVVDDDNLLGFLYSLNISNIKFDMIKQRNIKYEY